MEDFLSKNIRYMTKHPERFGNQVKAGEGAGVTQSAISKIGTGATKEAGYRTVAKIARHYGLSLDDLVFRDLEASGPSSQPARLDAGKLADLIETVMSAVQGSGKAIPPRAVARIVSALYADRAGMAPDAVGTVQATLKALLMSMEDA